MKQYRVIGASYFFVFSFLGCKNYENQKDKMIRFVCDYKAMQIENGNVDYENQCDLNRILSDSGYHADEFNRILFAEKRAERTGLKVVTADTLE